MCPSRPSSTRTGLDGGDAHAVTITATQQSTNPRLPVTRAAPTKPRIGCMNDRTALPLAGQGITPINGHGQRSAPGLALPYWCCQVIVWTWSEYGKGMMLNPGMVPFEFRITRLSLPKVATLLPSGEIAFAHDPPFKETGDHSWL